MDLIEFREKGMYCSVGQFYIDPYKGVDKAIISHGHGDHARYGSKHYLAHPDTVAIMNVRLGKVNNYQGLEYGEEININGVKISLHPAGHIIGSSQVRLEYQGEVWVFGGDYKTQDDGISQAFVPVPCHTFISECTFGLPIYNWKPQAEIFEDIHNWWLNNQQRGLASVILAYSLGKAQRIIHNLDLNTGPVYTHGSIYQLNKALREVGQNIPELPKVDLSIKNKGLYRNALIIAPPSSAGSPWLKRFSPFSLGVCSGWMALRGSKRRQAADKGFVLSDHADWVGLNSAIAATGCERVIATHGYTQIFAAWLREKGYDAFAQKTLFEDEEQSKEEVLPNVENENGEVN
ncbi:MAG: ligase-associated DNA damage response exonuclease [Bacteroidota bacterium]|nr:ligase-associated DNA damage response exonuclease [Bacteroidota bacterium]